jgi:anti-sigma B factor antagonist
MDIKVEQSGKDVCIILDGNLDPAGDKELAKALRAVQRFRDFDRVSFDMRKVYFATSSGIGRILNFYKVLETTERLMEINGISDSLYEQFKDIHLETLFPINKEKT